LIHPSSLILLVNSVFSVVKSLSEFGFKGRR
jgi:hypothetical protein